MRPRETARDSFSGGEGSSATTTRSSTRTALHPVENKERKTSVLDFSLMPKRSNVVELECSACGKKYDSSIEQHLCTCGKPLLARYDLRRAAAALTLDSLKSRSRTLWRYAEVLPNDPPVSLGEGMTALVHVERLGASIVCGQGGLQRLYIKDEGLNPTGSFKARGMTAAVSRAKQLGAK